MYANNVVFQIWAIAKAVLMNKGILVIMSLLQHLIQIGPIVTVDVLKDLKNNLFVKIILHLMYKCLAKLTQNKKNNIYKVLLIY